MDELYLQLSELVKSGDICGVDLSVDQVIKKLRRSMDLYRREDFNLLSAINSQAAVLVYRGACNDVAVYKGAEALPTTSQHIRKESKLSRSDTMRSYIKLLAEETMGDGVACFDQSYLTLRSYTSKIDFERSEAYVYPFEMWGQVGSRETPMHVDHGRSIAFILPCMTQTFKVWFVFRDFKAARGIRVRNDRNTVNRMLEDSNSSVVVQMPGDVVYVNNLVYHAVRLGYTAGTKTKDKSGMVGGNVIIRPEDRLSTYRYIMSAAIGVSKGSKEAWLRVLSTYTYMGGREWDDDQFEEEKELFLEKLKIDRMFRARSGASATKSDKKRKLTEKLAIARQSKTK